MRLFKGSRKLGLKNNPVPHHAFGNNETIICVLRFLKIRIQNNKLIILNVSSGCFCYFYVITEPQEKMQKFSRTLRLAKRTSNFRYSSSNYYCFFEMNNTTHNVWQLWLYSIGCNVRLIIEVDCPSQFTRRVDFWSPVVIQLNVYLWTMLKLNLLTADHESTQINYNIGLAYGQSICTNNLWLYQSMVIITGIL